MESSLIRAQIRTFEITNVKTENLNYAELWFQNPRLKKAFLSFCGCSAVYLSCCSSEIPLVFFLIGFWSNL